MGRKGFFVGGGGDAVQKRRMQQILPAAVQKVSAGLVHVSDPASGIDEEATDGCSFMEIPIGLEGAVPVLEQSNVFRLSGSGRFARPRVLPPSISAVPCVLSGGGRSFRARLFGWNCRKGRVCSLFHRLTFAVNAMVD
jgi:hypothetical protein